MAKVNLGVKVEPEMKYKVEYIAEKESIAFTDAVRYALLEHIRKYEKENGKITTCDLEKFKNSRRDNNESS